MNLICQERNSDKVYLVSQEKDKLSCFACSSPEDVCGVSACLAEVDFVGPIVLVQGHLGLVGFHCQCKSIHPSSIRLTLGDQFSLS